MGLYKSSNIPARRRAQRLVRLLRWLLAALLCVVATLLVGNLLGLWPTGADLTADAVWVWAVQVVVMWLAVRVVPPRRPRPETIAPPPAPDCVAPVAEYVVGAETVMTPAALEQLWLLQSRAPAGDIVLRPAVPEPGDEQAGGGRRD
jgi:hypothetical protein